MVFAVSSCPPDDNLWMEGCTERHAAARSEDEREKREYAVIELPNASPTSFVIFKEIHVARDTLVNKNKTNELGIKCLYACVSKPVPRALLIVAACFAKLTSPLELFTHVFRYKTWIQITSLFVLKSLERFRFELSTITTFLTPLIPQKLNSLFPFLFISQKRLWKVNFFNEFSRVLVLRANCICLRRSTLRDQRSLDLLSSYLSIEAYCIRRLYS